MITKIDPAATSIDGPEFRHYMRRFAAACHDPYSKIEPRAVEQTGRALMECIDIYCAAKVEKALANSNSVESEGIEAVPTPITWQPISTPPADARIVLLFCPDDEYPVWPGHFDGDDWVHATGWKAAPTHWAEVPQAPDVALISEGKTVIDEAIREPDWSAA